MGENSGVTWADHSWGPWRGCRKVRPEAECFACYAARDMKRYGKDFSKVVKAAPATFKGPLKWPAGRVFVCPWSDFWIEDADGWRGAAFEVMRRRPDHTYIIPTKRPELALERIREHEDQQFDNFYRLWPNVWGLVSAGTQATADLFVPTLLRTPFAVRGVSAEPLLEYVNFRKSWLMPYDKDHPGYVSWIVVGVESAPGKRVGRLGAFQSEQDWIDGAVTMVEQARAAGIATFVKQVPINGRVNDNPADWIPELRYQEFPK